MYGKITMVIKNSKNTTAFPLIACIKKVSFQHKEANTLSFFRLAINRKAPQKYPYFGIVVGLG